MQTTHLLWRTSGSIRSVEGLRAAKILMSSSKPTCMSYSTESAHGALVDAYDTSFARTCVQ